MPNSTKNTLTIGVNETTAIVEIDESCMSNVEFHFNNTSSGAPHGCTYQSVTNYPYIRYTIECLGTNSADSAFQGDVIEYYYSYDIDNSGDGCDDPHICTFEGKHYELD